MAFRSGLHRTAGDTIDVKYEDYYEDKPDDQPELSPSPKYQTIDNDIQSIPENDKLPRRPDIRLRLSRGEASSTCGGARRRPAFPAQHHAGVSRIPFHEDGSAGQQDSRQDVKVG